MKKVLCQWRKIGPVALLAGLMVMASGCATPRLWQATGDHHYQPFTAEPPRVLHDPANDTLLVVCRQYCDNHQHGAHNRQIGYWLSTGRADETTARSARLQPVSTQRYLWPLTVYVRYPVLPSSPKPEPSYGIYFPEERLLLVCLPNGKTVTNILPTAHVKVDPAKRILLTPMAVATDTVGAVAVAAGVAAVGAAEVAGYSYLPYYYQGTQNNSELGSPTAALVKRLAK